MKNVEPVEYFMSPKSMLDDATMTLDINLSEGIATSINLSAPQFTKGDEFYDFDDRWLDEVVYTHRVFVLCDGRNVPDNIMTFNQEKNFTRRDIITSVLDYERKYRPTTEWFGGIDCHHIFFEGLCEVRTGGMYSINWGS